MNLAIDGLALLSPTTGIARYTRELLMQFRDYPGISILIQYGLRWGTQVRDFPTPGVVVAKNAFKRVIPQSYELIRALRQLSFSMKVRGGRIDIYHAPNFMPLDFVGPTVITVHDLSFLRYPETHPAQRVRVMHRRVPKAIAACDYVLVDSEFVRQEVLDVYGAPPEKVITTYLGVSERFRPMSVQDTHTVLARHGLTHGKYVLSVGTLEPRKNLIGTLEAFGRLPRSLQTEYPLALGGMVGWHMERLGARLGQLAAGGTVRPLGYVPDVDLPYLYAGARGFIYPSLYEGFGLPVLEALAAGVPVITSNRASLREVAGTVAVALEPDDFGGLSEALRKALEQDADDAESRARRIAWARSFTWQRCAQQTLAVYRRAIERHRGAAKANG